MKIFNNWLPILAILVTAALLASGCTTTSTPTLAPTAADLLGAEWTLVEIKGSAPLAGSTTTLTINAGEIGGSAGCNSYGGKYMLQGRKLSFQDVFSTEMACTEPAGIMEQEQSFLQTLSQTVSFEVTGDRLELRDASAEASLVFER